MNMKKVKQELRKLWIGDIEYYSRNYLGTNRIYTGVKIHNKGIYQIEKNDFYYYDDNLKKHAINRKDCMINYIIRNLTKEQLVDYLKWFGIVI